MQARVFLLLLVLVLAPRVVPAQEINRYVNGTSGIKAGTVPPPGDYWLFYNFFYNADRLNGADDQPVQPDPGFQLLNYGNAHRFLFVTEKKILGADYAWNFVVPFVYTDIKIDNFGVSDTAFVLGDLNVEPFVIEWHKDRYDIGFVYGFYAPTASRSALRPAKPGANYWSHYVGPAGTLYLDEEKKWAASILTRYEVHTERRDQDVTAGDHFGFEWGFSHTLGQTLDVGVSGYATWQTSDDRGADAVNPGLRDRVGAYGPEIQYFSVKHKIGYHLRHWWEFGARDRAEGQITTLTLVKPF